MSRNIAPRPRGTVSPVVWDSLAAFLLCTALGVRLHVAAALQYWDMRDVAVVQLMSKHIAEGRDFPVFYYGQSHMGSLEALLGGLFAALFVVNGLTVALGTVLLGILALAAVHAITRHLAGPRAGCLALLPLVAGSDTLLYLSSHPRGGYTALLAFGLLGILFTLRWREHHRTHDLLACAFCLGLAWWSGQLSIVFFPVCALLLLPDLRLLRPLPLLAALLAFLLGSLPWWLWNLTHHWQTFGLLTSFDDHLFSDGFRHFAERLPIGLGFKPWPSPAAIAAACACALLSVVSIASLFRRSYTPTLRRGVASLALLFLSMLLLYSHSHFSEINSPRYLLPLLPVFPILSAIAVDALLPRRALALPALALLLLTISPNLLLLPTWNDTLPAHLARHAQIQPLIDRVEHEFGGVIQGDFLFNWITFASRERAIVAAAPDDVYAPYNRLAAFTPRLAFLEDYQGINAFLRASGGDAVHDSVPGYRITRDPIPPSNAWDYAPTPRRENTPDALYLHFDHPLPLCGLLLPDPTFAPRRIDVWGRSRDNAPWQPLLLNARTGHWFWSGGRPHWAGPPYLPELRFVPPPDGLLSLKITFPEDPDFRPLLVLPLLRAPEPPPPTSPTELLAHLRSLPPSHLLAPRQLALSWHDALPDGWTLSLPSFMYRNINNIPQAEPNPPTPLRLERPLLLLLDNRDLPRNRELLRSHHLPFTEIPLHEYTLLQLSPDQPETQLPLVWSECGFLPLPPPDTGPTPPPQHSTPASFANGVHLLGYDATLDSSSLHLTWHWTASSRARINRSIFVHLLNANGNILLQDDHNLSDFLRDPSTPRVFLDPRHLTLPENATPPFTLRIGLLDPRTQKRLPVSSPFAHRRHELLIPLSSSPKP